MLWKQAIECLMSTAEAMGLLAVGFAIFRQPIKSNWLKFGVVGFVISLLYIIQTEYSGFGEYAFIVQILSYIILISGVFELKATDSLLILVSGGVILSLLQLIVIYGYMNLGWLDEKLFQELLWNQALVQGSEVVGCLLILAILHKKKLGFLYKQTDYKKSSNKKLYLLLNGLLIFCLLFIQFSIIFFSHYPILLVTVLAFLVAMLFIILYTMNKQHLLRKKIAPGK